MQCIRFAVNEKPYCLWGYDVKGENLRFLNALDPTFFEYMANAHVEALDGEDANRAAVALRLNYGLAIETLLAFIGAAIQAPTCVFGWLGKYGVGDLIEVIKKVSDARPIHNRLRKDRLNWMEVSGTIHEFFRLDDQAKQERIVRRFADVWGRFADDFLDEKARAEFNGIKHGHRVQPGGFGVSVGVETTPGVPCPPDQMQMIGAARFGSGFHLIGSYLGSKTNLRSTLYSRNWAPSNYAYGLLLVSLSIHNVITWLKAANGADPTSLQIRWPEEDQQFDLPWSDVVPVTSGSYEELVEESGITPLTEQEILAVYRRDSESGGEKDPSG